MLKLALIGKNIQHSKSPDLYKEILKQDLQYKLLDYSNSTEIPSALKLLSEYDGISITSPYKKHFLAEVELTEQAKKIGAINCLGIKNGKIIGENTDFYAVVEIIQKLLKVHALLNVTILGDGAMSVLTKLALKECDVHSVATYSRKISDKFDHLNIVEHFNKQVDVKGQRLVINTCSRDYVFNGLIGKDTIFWDYNYNFLPHSNTLPSQVLQYVDGLEMLELQARYALAFWSIKGF